MLKTKDGLLYLDDRLLGVYEADKAARRAGFLHAEQFVKALTITQEQVNSLEMHLNLDGYAITAILVDKLSRYYVELISDDGKRRTDVLVRLDWCASSPPYPMEIDCPYHVSEFDMEVYRCA